MLSWTVAPSSRGRGIGSKMLLEVCKRFPEHKLTAEIKRDNQASLSMVLKCGFILSSKENDFEIWVRNDFVSKMAFKSYADEQKDS